MPDEAIPLLLKIIEDKSVTQEKVTYTQINLAEAFREKHEHKKGIDLLYAVLKKVDLSRYNYAYACNRMAALYNEWDNFPINHYDSVIKYSLQCLKIAKKDSLRNLEAASLNEISFVYRQQHEYHKAMEYCTKAYSIFANEGLNDNAINAAINMAGIFLSLNQPGKALTIIENASKLSSEEENRNLYLRLYLRMSDIYEKSGNYKEAFNLSSKIRKLQQDFYQDRHEVETSEMAAKYDLQLKEEEIKNINAEKKADRQQKTYLTIILSIVSLLFFLSILYFNLKQKNRLQKEQLIKHENEQLRLTIDARNEELLFKSKELTEAISNTISMNETLKSIKTQLKNGQTESSLIMIDGKLDTNLNWEQFHLMFNGIYPSFFNTLNHKLPTLTKNEMYLCAFLLMEMKTKEIANLMNISEVSVSKSRNRLRKKLEIENGSDITAFLKTLETN